MVSVFISLWLRRSVKRMRGVFYDENGSWEGGEEKDPGTHCERWQGLRTRVSEGLARDRR